MINYFAYGSNISPNRLKERNINFSSRKFAILENYELVFNKVSKKNNKMAFASVLESNNSFVEGALYELNDSDIKIIDRFEGFPSHYQKIFVKVICENKLVNALMYIANINMIKENIKPNRNYLNYILAGKDIFSNDYYNKLLLTETLD